METVGSVFDKLTILEKRMSVLDNDHNALKLLRRQRGWLIRELGRIIVNAAEEKIPATFKKHKVYDKDVKGAKTDSIIQAIINLRNYNEMLWNLEDRRRNMNLSSEERLTAADEVSNFNKKRNDAIDQIDDIVDSSMKASSYV